MHAWDAARLPLTCSLFAGLEIAVAVIEEFAATIAVFCPSAFRWAARCYRVSHRVIPHLFIPPYQHLKSVHLLWLWRRAEIESGRRKALHADLAIAVARPVRRPRDLALADAAFFIASAIAEVLVVFDSAAAAAAAPNSSCCSRVFR